MTITTGICGVPVPKVLSFRQTYGNLKEDVKCLFFFSKKPLFRGQQKQPTQKKNAEFHPILKQTHWYHADATTTEKSNTQKKHFLRKKWTILSSIKSTMKSVTGFHLSQCGSIKQPNDVTLSIVITRLTLCMCECVTVYDTHIPIVVSCNWKICKKPRRWLTPNNFFHYEYSVFFNMAPQMKRFLHLLHLFHVSIW